MRAEDRETVSENWSKIDCDQKLFRWVWRASRAPKMKDYVSMMGQTSQCLEESTCTATITSCFDLFTSLWYSWIVWFEDEGNNFHKFLSSSRALEALLQQREKLWRMRKALEHDQTMEDEESKSFLNLSTVTSIEKLTSQSRTGFLVKRNWSFRTDWKDRSIDCCKKWNSFGNAKYDFLFFFPPLNVGEANRTGHPTKSPIATVQCVPNVGRVRITANNTGLSYFISRIWFCSSEPKQFWVNSKLQQSYQVRA